MKGYLGYLTTPCQAKPCHYCNALTNQKVKRVNYCGHRVPICDTCNRIRFEHYEITCNDESYFTNYKTISEFIQDFPKKWIDYLIGDCIIDLNPTRNYIFQYGGDIGDEKKWERGEGVLDVEENLRFDKIKEIIAPHTDEKEFIKLDRQLTANYIVKVNDKYDARKSTIDWMINKHPCETKFTRHSHKEGCFQIVLQNIVLAPPGQKYFSKKCFFINTKVHEIYLVDISDECYNRVVKFLTENEIYRYNSNVDIKGD